MCPLNEDSKDSRNTGVDVNMGEHLAPVLSRVFNPI
jgi:hypothetical protein